MIAIKHKILLMTDCQVYQAFSGPMFRLTGRLEYARIVFNHRTCIVNKNSYQQIQYCFWNSIIPTLFYICYGVLLAIFQKKDKRVFVVTLKVQTTVVFGPMFWVETC